jgi:hypothetical protein
MYLSAGTVEYTFNSNPVIGCGISYTAEELEEVLRESVCEIVFDRDGYSKLASLLESVSETDFEKNEIKRILESNHEPENWRVGEALAEVYLILHRSCNFPWPDGRDERKSGSSLPGADLVGFQLEGEVVRFAFGEVKTSSEMRYPPGSMYGETGLKIQLEDLRDKDSIRNDLVKYLGYRAVNAPWREHYINACKRYLANNADVKLFGLLIRDVTPHKDDLLVRVSKMKKNCPTKMSIELLAVYLPLGSIKTLSQKVIAARREIIAYDCQ